MSENETLSRDEAVAMVNNETPRLVRLAKEIQAEQGCTAVSALRIAKARIEADAPPKPERRRLVDHGDGPTVRSLFIDHEQVAAVVLCYDGTLQLTSTLSGRPDGLLPVQVRDREQGDLWLQFLGDLYDGNFKQ